MAFEASIPGPSHTTVISGPELERLPSSVTVVMVQVSVCSGPASATGKLASCVTSTSSKLEHPLSLSVTSTV